MTVYQPSIPTGTVNLDVDYQNIQANFQQLDTTYGVDHIAYSQAVNNGYHSAIHMVAQGAIPIAPVSNTGELYTYKVNDGINTDTTLYYQTESGIQTKLTRNFLPVAANNGYTFLPGGLMLQWGRKTGYSGNWPTNSQQVLFATNNINFSSSCFAVFVTFIGPTSGSSGDIVINSTTNTLFNWQFTGSSSAGYGGFYWVAIGI